MNCVLLAFLLLQASEPVPASHLNATQNASEQLRIERLISEVARSGRVLSVVPRLDESIRVAPGAPPLLTFRYLEGRQRGRFGGLDLVLDDAGH